MKDVGEQLAEQLKKRNWTKNYQQLIRDAFEDKEVRAFIRNNQTELTQEDIAKSASKVYEFVSVKNKIKRGEETLAPGYDPQLTLNNHLIDVTYVPSEALMVQKKRQAVHNRVRSINMPKNIRDAELADYDLEGRELAAEAAGRFIEEYTSSPKKFHRAMYLQGSFGVGKTYLLGAIANGLAEEGVASTLLHFPSFAVEMKNSIGNNGTMKMVDEVKRTPVLMLDDIGADQLSSWIRDDILGVILQYRMQEELPTFFSSNLDMVQLEKQYLTTNNRGEAEPLKAKRIMERIRFLAEEFRIVGRNRRQFKK
ncbi:primosomal protein DnaI [Liquorilactobacillus uvarum]|uniref:Primosomal protein DnaI n=1 Tax=Liquorilactobacillus uvarum DSM 19971 TaxID=1423812 RepID=A0A0R1Q217_9LACO|nr:primosomal protein DnaI [Liquorilactobacillus uvarum]KRL38609.1 primosomal protein DnaI [Liquorilactobacillus uvarum DSM 19971]